MRRLSVALPTLLLFMALSVRAAEPEPAQRVLPRPSWAWGTLGMRNIEGTLSNLALYCDRVATNSGALARLSLSTLLFPVPMEEGLKKDGAAVIFFLDPGLVGGAKGEKALILEVQDPALLKESLEAVFGVNMKDQLLEVSVPRGFTEPDANLMIKLVPAGLLVAPNEQILKELESLAGKDGAVGFVDPMGPDVVAEVNVEVLRRVEQRSLENALAQALKATAVASPSSVGQVTEGQQQLQKFLKELERVEFQAQVDARGIRVQTSLRALADTELAMRWQALGEPPLKRWVRWCDPETALFVTGRFPSIWACSEKDVGQWMGKYLPMESAPGRVAQESVARELASWLQQLEGDVALAVQVDREGAFFPLTLFAGKADGQVSESLEKLLPAIVSLLSERLRTQFELPGDAIAPAVLEKGETSPTGVTVHSVRFQNPALEEWAKHRFGGISGWPLQISLRRSVEGVVLGWGKGAEVCLAAEPEVRGDADDPLGLLPGGSTGCALLHPLPVMRAYLRQGKHLDEGSVEAILNGLGNTPLRVCWGQGDGTVFLELHAPAEALRTVISGYMNYLKQGFDPAAPPAPKE